jgi:hypothetical protein
MAKSRPPYPAAENAAVGSRCCCTWPAWMITARDPAPRTVQFSAGHGAEAVRDAIARSIQVLPDEFRRLLTGISARRWLSMHSFVSTPAWRSTSAIYTGVLSRTELGTHSGAVALSRGRHGAPLPRPKMPRSRASAPTPCWAAHFSYERDCHRSGSLA